MPRKYDLISELYDRTSKAVTSNAENWQSFLRTACRNYKLRYDEQILIYAQRPDAIAVLEIEQWNGKFGRWVNKGAKGIAVFSDENRERQWLTHYFDISDTHESRYSRPVPIWQMRDEYIPEVIETLENSFGTLENNSHLPEAIISAARNAVEGFLSGLDENMIESMYKSLVTNSVAYMMMRRIGIEPSDYFENSDFVDVTNFNTQDTLNSLGFATSDIAEMGLTEVAKTVIALERNRIIADQKENEYNKVTKENERSFENERNHLPNLKLPEQPQVELGRYAQMRRTYLKEQHKVLYYNFLTKGTLIQHLAEVEQRAIEMEETLMKQMAAQEGLTEQVKATDMMDWIRKNNNLKNRVQEIVRSEVIYA